MNRSPLRYVPLVLCVIFLACNGDTGSGRTGILDGQRAVKGARTMKAWAISYEVESSDGGLTLIVAPNGECQLTRTSGSLSSPPGADPEIGAYYHKFSEESAESLKNTMKEFIGQKPGKVEPVLPGTFFLTFGFLSEGEGPRLRSFPQDETLPQSADRVNKRMEEIVAEMLKHPVQTLKGSAAWERPEISGKQEVKVRVKLRNSGTMAIRIRNPAAAQDDRSIGLHILIEKDMPPDEMTMLDQAAPPIRRNEVAQVSAPGFKDGSSPSPVVKLEPNQELVFSIAIRSPLYLGRGKYRGVVNYESMTEGIPKEEAVPGSLHIQSGKFTVKGR